jgi:hypothetical protein
MPASGQLSIAITNLPKAKFKLKLLSYIGEELAGTAGMSDGKSESKAALDISNIASGAYMLVLEIGRDKHVKNIVIEK